MTDDLKARLREACFLAFFDGESGVGTDDFGTAVEAADRIAALEAALADMTQQRDAAMALTAAAYEDAASYAEDGFEKIERLLPFATDYGNACAHTGQHEAAERIADGIRARTHADALTALSRIEAQAEARGMRKAAEEWVNVRVEGGHAAAAAAAAALMAYSDHILALADATEVTASSAPAHIEGAK